MEHLHRVPHSITKIDPKRIAQPRVLDYIQIPLHQFQHAGITESVIHQTNNRSAARTLSWSLASFQRNQVDRSQRFHFLRWIFRQYGLGWSNVDNRSEFFTD